MKVLKTGLASGFLRSPQSFSEFGTIRRFGFDFANPLGLAAGFDKNGVAAAQLESLGFGFIEIGTVTFHPQPGNPKPRLFRLPRDQALINRAGFNNEGAAAAAERLRRKRPGCVLGVNIGKSKIVPNEEAVEDYLKSFELIYDAADYIVINVSSPNTPNLRDLQQADVLEELLGALQKRNSELFGRSAGVASIDDAVAKAPRLRGTSGKPLLVKIAPDLHAGDIEAVAGICLRLNLAGIIATNTTVTRDGLTAARDEIEKIGAGGLSGKPLTRRSTEIIAQLYRHTNGKLPIIGVGGIFAAEDAFTKIAAGACLLQGYTGFIYEGFDYAHNINAGLAKILRERGFDSLDEAVGSNIK